MHGLAEQGTERHLLALGLRLDRRAAEVVELKNHAVLHAGLSLLIEYRQAPLDP